MQYHLQRYLFFMSILVKSLDVRQSLFTMMLYIILKTTYSKTLHIVKYHSDNIAEMIFCLLGYIC